MSVRSLVAGVVLVGLAVLAFVFFEFGLRHRTEIRGARAWVRFYRTARVQDIREVHIVDGGSTVVLRPARERAQIARLLRSLQGIQVEDRERFVAGPTGTIIVVLRRPGRSFTLAGDFDPDHAPVITPSMRSHDLGRVVQRIIGDRR